MPRGTLNRALRPKGAWETRPLLPSTWCRLRRCQICSSHQRKNCNQRNVTRSKSRKRSVTSTSSSWLRVTKRFGNNCCAGASCEDDSQKNRGITRIEGGLPGRTWRPAGPQHPNSTFLSGKCTQKPNIERSLHPKLVHLIRIHTERY